MKNAFSWLWETLTAPVRFAARALTESDGNGGKVSYSRILGVYVVYKITVVVETALADGKELGSIVVPEAYITMFWVLVGYQILSKTLSTMSPAVLDIARALLLKAQMPPPPKEPQS